MVVPAVCPVAQEKLAYRGYQKHDDYNTEQLLWADERHPEAD